MARLRKAALLERHRNLGELALAQGLRQHVGSVVTYPCRHAVAHFLAGRAVDGALSLVGSLDFAHRRLAAEVPARSLLLDSAAVAQDAAQGGPPSMAFAAARWEAWYRRYAHLFRAPSPGEAGPLVQLAAEQRVDGPVHGEAERWLEAHPEAVWLARGAPRSEERARERMFTERQGLPERIEGVVALDARRVIVWSGRGDVQRWDVVLGNLELAFDGEGADVIGVGDDGLVVRKTRDGFLDLLDVRAGVVVGRTRRPFGDARAAGLARNEGLFAACGAAVYVFDATSCDLLAIHEHPRETGGVHAVWGSDGRIVSYAGDTIRAWDARTGELVATLVGLPSEATDVFALDDGRVAATTAAGEGCVWVVPPPAPSRSKAPPRRAPELSWVGRRKAQLLAESARVDFFDNAARDAFARSHLLDFVVAGAAGWFTEAARSALGRLPLRPLARHEGDPVAALRASARWGTWRAKPETVTSVGGLAGGCTAVLSGTGALALHRAGEACAHTERVSREASLLSLAGARVVVWWSELRGSGIAVYGVQAWARTAVGPQRGDAFSRAIPLSAGTFLAVAKHARPVVYGEAPHARIATLAMREQSDAEASAAAILRAPDAALAELNGGAPVDRETRAALADVVRRMESPDHSDLVALPLDSTRFVTFDRVDAAVWGVRSGANLRTWSARGVRRLGAGPVLSWDDRVLSLVAAAENSVLVALGEDEAMVGVIEARDGSVVITVRRDDRFSVLTYDLRRRTVVARFTPFRDAYTSFEPFALRDGRLAVTTTASKRRKEVVEAFLLDSRGREPALRLERGEDDPAELVYEGDDALYAGSGGHVASWSTRTGKRSWSTSIPWFSAGRLTEHGGFVIWCHAERPTVALLERETGKLLRRASLRQLERDLPGVWWALVASTGARDGGWAVGGASFGLRCNHLRSEHCVEWSDEDAWTPAYLRADGTVVAVSDDGEIVALQLRRGRRRVAFDVVEA